MITQAGGLERSAAPIGHARRRLIAVGALIVLLAAAGVLGYAAAGGFAARPGEEVSRDVMQAWATGDTADIEAVYAEDVVMILDGEPVATSREEIASVINGAIAFGNTYRQFGEVTTYEHASGDLYVSTVVEVVGLGHPDGDAVIGFYRVHDGKVVRHVFMDAEHY